MAQRKPDPETVDVVRARRLEIVDDKGNVLAVLEARGQVTGEGASLTMADETGVDRLFLAAFKEGGELAVSGGAAAADSIVATVSERGFALQDEDSTVVALFGR